MKTILIVEDDDSSSELFNDLLLKNGYNTLQAKTGREALKMAKEHHPDLILMDFLLPGLSGQDATLLIKKDEDLKDIPVIATTALPFGENEKTITESGFQGYIAKPISIPDALETITRFLPD